MDRNPNDILRQQEETDAYIETKIDEAVDLTVGIDKEKIPTGTNDSIKAFAAYLFGRDLKTATEQLTGILPDVAGVPDMFCMLTELVLYGLDALSQGKSKLFDIDMTDEKSVQVVDIMQLYFKSTGIKVTIVEEDVMHEDINYYRDRTDYYCMISRKPPNFMMPLIEQAQWIVLDYMIIPNRSFSTTDPDDLKSYFAFFVSKQRKVYNLKFDLITHPNLQTSS